MVSRSWLYGHYQMNPIIFDFPGPFGRPNFTLALDQELSE